jgi:hypothetical protein
MSNTAHQKIVPVAQDDREAAADMHAHIMRELGDAAPAGHLCDIMTERMRVGWHDHDESVQAFARHRPAFHFATSQEGAWVPDRFTLSERELDDKCGCPEETWDTPFGVLNMHLTAGKPSNACLDNGDEGEWSIDLTRATVTEARSAFFAWSMIAARLPAATPADKLRQAREEGYRAGYTQVLGLTRTGVPTSDFERDVGAYMADFVRRRA